MNNLIRSLMQQVIKDDIVVAKEGNDLEIVNLENKENWKKLNQIEIGMKAKNLLLDVKENEKKRFLMNIRAALFSTISYLKKNLPFTNQILKDLEMLRPLEPNMLCTHGLYAITRVANYLHFSEEFIDLIREEWKLLLCDEQAHQALSKSIATSNSRIDIYWRTLANFSHHHNHKMKYNNLLQLIKTALVIPHGNSDPERGFSINSNMMKANFNENTIECLRLVKDTIRNHGGVRSVPITMGLLNDVKHSHRAYQQYAEKKKLEEEKQMKEKNNKEKENKQKEENLKRKFDIEDKMKEIDANLSSLKSEKNIALGIITEGSARLSKGIAEKNNLEMSIASSLIEQATAQLKKCENKISEMEIEKAALFNKRIKAYI